MILLKDLMTSPVISIGLETRIIDAIELMERNYISALVITRDQRPIGIFTERSLLRAKLSTTFDHDLTIKTVMTANPVTAHLNDTIHEAYLLFLQHGIRHLVIVHDDGTVAGITTETDFLQGLGLEYFVSFNDISRIATQHVIHQPPYSTVFSAMRLMNRHKISSIVVLADQQPVGIITERDIVRLIRTKIDINTTPLETVMSQPVLTVSRDISAHLAAELLRKKGVRRLVIVKKDGTLNGIVTETDIITGLKSEYIDLLKEVIETQGAQLQTVRKQLDERMILESMMHSTIDIAFVITDLHFTVLQFNRSAELLFGYARQEICGQSIKTLLLQEGVDSERFNETVELIHLRGSYSFTHTRTSQDQQIHIDSNIFGIRGDHSAIQGYVLIGKDITQQLNTQEHLRKRSQELEETNAALRVLLKQREIDREEINRELQKNIEHLVLPFFARLRTTTASSGQKQIISSIEANLGSITSPLAHKVSSLYAKLTPAEIQVVNLIKNGHSSKEVAGLLNLSPGTVYTHRRNIRKKSGITNKKVNLQTILNQLE